MNNNNVSDDTWTYLKTLYGKCIDLPPEERSRFLQDHCQSDSLLREEIESLLKLGENACDPLGERTQNLQSSTWPVSHGDEWIGKVIGPYRISRLIAQGGMGAVYLASRNDGTYDKKVAIKLLDQKYVSNPLFINRFKREQQTLANLDHPNITKLLDGGLTANGVPYIIMEYVEGVRIDKYCRQHALSQRQRLLLFCRVCAAVQYANQNLIVHRDLKPSNILVTSDGTPKLLDFGISKVFDPQDQINSEITLPAMRIFTPRYASPEQMRGTRMTTLSDVFSLGLILYELLVGKMPFAEPPLSDDSNQTFKHKCLPIRPLTIDKSFPTDLETILLKSISYDPQDRYQSANDLSEDLHRFLANQTIHARTPSPLYQFRKLVTRHKWTSITVATLTVCLLGLSTGMTILYTRANQETRNANEVVDILEGVFTTGYANWFTPKSTHMTINFRVSDTIKYAENYLNSDASMNVTTRYRLHRLLGKAYYHINDDLEQARQHMQVAHELNVSRFNARHPMMAESLLNLGYLELSRDLRAKYFKQAYTIHRDTIGEDNIDTIVARIEWGGALISQGKLKAGEAITNEGLANLRKITSSNNGIVVHCLIRVGANYINGGYREIGEATLLKALDYSYRTAGKLTPAAILSSLSKNSFFLGELEKAEDYARRAVADVRKVVEKYHPATFQPLWWLGHTLSFQGKTEEAIPLLEEALIIVRVAYGNNGDTAIRPLHDLAGIQWSQGNYELAEKHFRELIEITKQQNKSHLYQFGLRNSLAVVLRDAGKFEESLRYFEEALRIAVSQFGPHDLWAVRVENNMARLLMLQDNLKQAEKLILHVIDIRETEIATDLFDIIESKMVYGIILTKMGRLKDAECLLRDAYSARMGLFDANHRQIVEAKIALADWLLADGQIDQAEILLEESLEALQSQFRDQHVLIRLAKQSLSSIHPDAHLAVSSQPLEKLSYSLSR